MLQSPQLLPFALVFSLVTLQATFPAMAFKLKDVVKKVGNIAKDVAKLPNPVTTPIQILTGNQNPLQPGEFIKQQGQAIGSIAVNTRSIAAVATDVPGQAIESVAGKEARAFFEFVTLEGRMQREFALTTAQQAGAVLQGQDPIIVLAMPVAAAIRDARALYASKAQPLPEDLKKLFAPIIPRQVLDRTRYTVDKIKISIPGLINTGAELLGHDYAVTVDDIIVFSQQPDFDNINDLVHTAHEIFHVHQYALWGVDQFAFNYIKNNRAVEDQAKAAGSVARSYLQQVLSHGQVSKLTLEHASATAFAPRVIDTAVGQTTIMAVVTPTETQQPSFNKPKGFIEQPVFTNPGQYVGRCDINGETIYTTQSYEIIAPMRGYISFGRHTPPLSPVCGGDLVFPAGRMCVLPNGNVFLGNLPVGQCVQCGPGICP